jgi:ATP-binding cassette, subfamily B, bacterial
VEEPRRYSDTELYRRLAALARPYWAHLSALFLLSLLATPLALLVPVPLKIAVDSALGSHPLPGFVDTFVPGGTQSHSGALLIAIVLLVAVAVLTQLQQLAVTVLSSYTGEKLLIRLRSRLFGHVQRLSLSYHDTRGTADANYRIQYDATAIQWIAVTGLIPVVEAIFMLVGMVYVTALIDWQLALVAMTIVPVLLIVTNAYRQRLRRRWRRAKELESSAMSVVQEVLTGLRLVKAFGQEEREQDRYVARAAEGMTARIRLAMVDGVFGVILGLTATAGSGVVLYVGVHRVQSGVITLGELLVVMGYLTQLYTPLQTVSRQAGKVQSSLASAERAFKLLDEEPDVPERRHARRLKRAAGDIECCDVTFAYGTGPPALRRASFHVPAGTRVGIAGTTGSGKSTLASLLMRFYDPTGGRILLDGVDLRDYRLADLRNQFALVLQDPILFSTTILENIAYARPGARIEEIVAAARAANAHDFITRLPDGYNTVLGERGATLSGGERQRIALARAILKDAPILVLDEPTSSVDVRTESVIMDAMERLMSGRTTFMIAHRLGTLSSCDIRLQIEDGQVASMDDGDPAKAARARSRRRPAPPKVVDLARDALARTGQTPRLVADEPLNKPLKRSVRRLRFDAGGRADSVVVKRLTPRRAQTARLLAERWLPATGLEWACARVLGAATEPGGRAVWLVYEDLQANVLDCRFPDSTQVGPVVELIAELHARFCGHALLAECREHGEDLGMDFFSSEVTRCVRHLRSIQSSAKRPSQEDAALTDRLLGRLECLYDERQQRARMFAAYARPDTLLHGDLWTTNTLVVDGTGGPQPRLIDWDHAGVGPATYDISTFLYRFPREHRPWILDHYREALACRGWRLPDDRELNALFETAEYARYACCLAEAALAASQGKRWGLEQMAEIDTWFARLEPVLAVEP